MTEPNEIIHYLDEATARSTPGAPPPDDPAPEDGRDDALDEVRRALASIEPLSRADLDDTRGEVKDSLDAVRAHLGAAGQWRSAGRQLPAASKLPQLKRLLVASSWPVAVMQSSFNDELLTAAQALIDAVEGVERGAGALREIASSLGEVDRSTGALHDAARNLSEAIERRAEVLHDEIERRAGILHDEIQAGTATTGLSVDGLAERVDVLERRLTETMVENDGLRRDVESLRSEARVLRARQEMA